MISQCVEIPEGRVQRRRSQSFFSGAQTEAQEVPSEQQETLFFYRHRLLKEVVESPKLEMFKIHLDMVLGSLLWLTLPEQGDWAR